MMFWSFNSSMTGATIGAEAAYRSGVPEFSG